MKTKTQTENNAWGKIHSTAHGGASENVSEKAISIFQRASERKASVLSRALQIFGFALSINDSDLIVQFLWPPKMRKRIHSTRRLGWNFCRQVAEVSVGCKIGFDKAFFLTRYHCEGKLREQRCARFLLPRHVSREWCGTKKGVCRWSRGCGQIGSKGRKVKINEIIRIYLFPLLFFRTYFPPAHSHA